MCVCTCARARVRGPAPLTLSCPARRPSAPRSYKDIDFPPRLPEQDQMSSRSDTSLTFQWGFLFRLVCVYCIFFFFKKPGL